METLALTLSTIVLIATGIQLYIQREHKVKSLQPLAQIDFGEQKNHIHIYMTNYGMGPLIINELIFEKNGILYDNITSCLTIDPKTYVHAGMDHQTSKVVLPNKYIKIFETGFVESGDESTYNPQPMDTIKEQLSKINLTVNYSDIYDNKFTVSTKLDFFIRNTGIKQNKNDLSILPILSERAI